MTRLINDWSELARVPDSPTHRIKIVENWGGWIVNKNTKKEEYYLSTHIFYKKSGLAGKGVFKKYGFDIEISTYEEQGE